MRTHIDKVGRYPVEQIPCPHSSQVINNPTPTGVLHTTEGWWAPSLAEFKHKFAPHFILGLKDAHTREYGIAQLVPIGVAGRACRGHNDQALVQIEMIGFSKEQLWLPDMITLEILASLFNVCNHEWGIKLHHPWHDGDFGLAGLAPRNTHRAAGFLGKISGWYGHGDMPNPDVHWDPGNLQWSKVFDKCVELAHQAEAPLVS